MATIQSPEQPTARDTEAGGATPPEPAGGVLQQRLTSAWADWRIGAAAATGSGVLYGLVAGLLTPRGPVTTAQALITMASSLAVGFMAGGVMRSRWAALIAPAAFVAVFELVRLGAEGPTVDALHPGTTYGIMAIVVGRGFHGVLALAPMVLGAIVGAGTARTLDRPGPTGRIPSGTGPRIRQGLAVFSGLLLVAVAALVARPAGTDAIVDADGQALPDSIAELTTVTTGGPDGGEHELAMMIRGRSVDSPVLLFLAGGPGGSELGAMRNHAQVLEEDFVVVTLDQRGTGKSHHELEPTSTLTLDNAISDVIEVTNHLRERFDQDKIYLVGQSWGSLLGVLAAQEEPQLFHAFVGTGQMVSPLETDRIFYRDTLAWARANDDRGLVETLERIGEPPYDNILDYEPALSYEHEVYPYDHSPNSEGEGGFSENIFAGEYTLLEQVHNLGSFLDVFTILYPQIQDIDFRVDAAELDVPVYLIQGANEADGRAVLADEWFALLDAPAKGRIVLDTSGHRPIFEQPTEFHSAMTDVVLAETGN